MAIIISIIWGIGWGIGVDNLAKRKGYDENWFWWGFFFSIIALLIVDSKPDLRDNGQYIENNITQDLSVEAEKASLILQYKELLDEGIISQSEFDEKKKQLLEI